MHQPKPKITTTKLALAPGGGQGPCAQLEAACGDHVGGWGARARFGLPRALFLGPPTRQPTGRPVDHGGRILPRVDIAGASRPTCEKFFPKKASRHLAPHSICAEEKRPLRCSVRHTAAAWRRTRQHAQGELGRAQGREDRHLRHGKRRSYARARAPARRAWVAKEEPETVAENAPLGTAPAAPGITRPTPGRRRAPRVVRAGTPVSWGVRSVLTTVRRHGATSNPVLTSSLRGMHRRYTPWRSSSRERSQRS